MTGPDRYNERDFSEVRPRDWIWQNNEYDTRRTGTLALLSTSKIGRTDPVLSPAIYRFLVHAVDVALPFELAASYHSASDYCVGANPVLRKV